MGPYHNPQETYEYFKLPFCRVRLRLVPLLLVGMWFLVFLTHLSACIISLYYQPELGIQLSKKPLSIGEQLEGHDLTNSGYDIHFGQDVPPTKLCSQYLDKISSVVFASAVDVHYWFVQSMTAL